MPDLADNALTNLAAVNGELGYTDGADTARDGRIQRYINEGSALFARLTGVGWHYQEDLVERVKGHDTPFLRVTGALPISSISSIEWDNRSGTTSTVTSSDYAIDEANRGTILRVSGAWDSAKQSYLGASMTPKHGTNRAFWKVTYTGGYITPKQEDDGVGTRDLPYDIEGAVIAFAVMRHRMAGSAGNIRSIESLGDKIEYMSDANGQQHSVPASFKSTVALYRRW